MWKCLQLKEKCSFETFSGLTGLSELPEGDDSGPAIVKSILFSMAKRNKKSTEKTYLYYKDKFKAISDEGLNKNPHALCALIQSIEKAKFEMTRVYAKVSS